MPSFLDMMRVMEVVVREGNGGSRSLIDEGSFSSSSDRYGVGRVSYQAMEKGCELKDQVRVGKCA